MRNLLKKAEKQAAVSGIPRKIKKGDKFLCLNDYLMEDETVAYSKNKEYLSEVNKCITDNSGDVFHRMELPSDFFDFFKFID